MTDIDITIDVPELEASIEKTRIRIDQIKTKHRDQLIERLSAEAKKFGFNSLDELIGHVTVKRGRPRRAGNGSHV